MSSSSNRSSCPSCQKADAVASDRTVLRGRRFPDSAPVQVEIHGGRIQAVTAISDLNEPAGTERWITPGFYDLQVNGFAGIDLGEPGVTRDEIHGMACAVLRTGCTRFLPTIITADLEVMCRQLTLLADAIDADPLIAAMCPGFHVEGPFIHPEDGPRGAHPRQHVRQPNVPDFDRLFTASRGRMRILTVAPEQPGAVEVIREATRRGVVVGLGHHRADRASIAAAVEAGARMTTHLGNGTDAQLPRHDNYVWWQLGEDRLWASLVADGHHLPPASLKCMIRAKTLDRAVLITDAMAAAAMSPGRFRLGKLEVEKTEDGRVCLPGTPYFAGSAAEMPIMLHQAVASAGLSFLDAVRLVTLQPAKLVPTAVDPWSCTPGAFANLTECLWRPDNATVAISRAIVGEFATEPR